jgi:hypothetical protein
VFGREGSAVFAGLLSVLMSACEDLLLFGPSDLALGRESSS